MEQLKPQIAQAIQRGFTRAEICREISIGRATLYRWFIRKPDFRQWFETLEKQNTEARNTHRWFTHPFRGRRPPAEPGTFHQAPRYGLLTRNTKGALVPWTPRKM